MIDVYTAVTLIIYLIWKVRQQSGTSAVVVNNQVIDDSLQALTLQVKNGGHHYQDGDFYFLSFKKRG